MDRVIGYARVSTVEQAESGISLDAQRHRLQAYCHAHGLTMARVEDDAGISARRTTNRPALQRALQALQRGEVVGLVAVKLDRLSRTTRDVLDLVARAEEESLALHSIEERLDKSSAQGRFVVTLLGALSQLKGSKPPSARNSDSEVAAPGEADLGETAVWISVRGWARC